MNALFVDARVTLASMLAPSPDRFVGVSGFSFFELWQRYGEGGEDQLGAPGLVVNGIVLWNTHYVDRALESLSPLGHEHSSLHGRYHFGLP